MYFFCGAMIATEVTQYKAKYQFDSEEISISGIREFKKNNDGYELKFRASNIVASMFFISEFDIDEVGVRSNSYQIKIRPKFLKRSNFYFNIDLVFCNFIFIVFFLNFFRFSRFKIYFY